MTDLSDPPANRARTVTVRLPGLLARFTDGRDRVTVAAETATDVVDALLADYPALEPHLLDGDGRLRPHLQLFHNGREIDPAGDVTLETGDEVVLFQAVSGG